MINYEFLIITSEDSGMVFKQALKHNISPDDIRVISVSRNEVPLYLSLSEVSLFFIKPTFSKLASSPTKQGEIMSLGIPLICNAGVGDTDFVVSKYRSGITVRNFTNQEFDQAIDRSDELLQLNAESIRRGAIEFYSLDEGVSKYDSVYNKLRRQ